MKRISLTPLEKEAYKATIISHGPCGIVAEDRTFIKSGMQIRMIILHASLYFEEKLSHLLSIVLGIKDTSSFDMPFEKQIAMFSMTGTIDAKDKQLLDVFRILRNKFIHKMAMDSFTVYYAQYPTHRELVMKLLMAKEDLLNRTYEATEEERLEVGTRLLIAEVTRIQFEVMEKMLKAERDKTQAEIMPKIIKRWLKDGDIPFNTLVQEIDKMDRSDFSKLDVKNLINELRLKQRHSMNIAATEEMNEVLKSRSPSKFFQKDA